MKRTLQVFLLLVALAAVGSAQAPSAVLGPFGAPIAQPSNDTSCLNSCNEGEVCLLCPDGNSGCFSNKLANHYCCGCDDSVGRCTACSNANLCVENSGSGLKWECKSPTVTLIVLSIMGGVLLAFVLLIVLAFLWHRRSRSNAAKQQQSANGVAPTEDDALLSFRADSTLGIYHSWPPTAVTASIAQAQPTTDQLTSQDTIRGPPLPPYETVPRMRRIPVVARNRTNILKWRGNRNRERWLRFASWASRNGAAKSHFPPIDSEFIMLEDGDIDIESSVPASTKAERMIENAAGSTHYLKPDIVFLGAGPVGLWTAVQTKILVPWVEIVLVEKYQVYQRSHVLRLDKASFKHCVKENKELTDLVASWPKFIRTNDMEDGLLKLAQKLGIKICFQAIRDGDELVQLFPSARIFVGSDGSHSVIRHSMFGNDLSVQKDIQMTAEVKYEVEGTTKSLNYVTETYPCLKLMHYVATESIGKPRDGKTPVTLRLLIDSEAHKTVADASFKTPFYFPSHGHLLHPKLKSAINIWLNAKEHFSAEKRVPGSEKLTALKLSVYRARNFHTVYNCKGTNVDVFLVGDSAFGVPFFRALNNGFLCGSHLAFTLAKSVDATKKNNLTVVGNFLQWASRGTQVGSFMMDKLQLGLSQIGHKVFFETNPAGYNDYVNALADAEIMNAEGKKTALKLFKIGNEINGAVPWQVLRFSSEVEAKLRKDIAFAPPLIR